MKFLFLFLFLSLSANCSEQSEAKDKALEAILTYPQIKNGIDFHTKRLIKKIDLDESFVKNFAIAAFMVQNKKISTEKINNIKFDTNFGKIRPDFYYNVNNRDIGVLIKYNWSFE